MDRLNMERFRRAFDACLGPVPKKPLPLNGIEKEAILQQEEMEALEAEFRREFGEKGKTQ